MRSPAVGELVSNSVLLRGGGSAFTFCSHAKGGSSFPLAGCVGACLVCVRAAPRRARASEQSAPVYVLLFISCCSAAPRPRSHIFALARAPPAVALEAHSMVVLQELKGGVAPIPQRWRAHGRSVTHTCACACRVFVSRYCRAHVHACTSPRLAMNDGSPRR